MDSQNLIESLNTASEKLFSNIEGEAYEILDKITLVNENILKNEPLKVFLKNDNVELVCQVAKSLVFIYVIYYIVMQFISLYNGNSSENVFIFIIKLTVIYILIDNSYFLCEKILNLFGLFTEAIDSIGLKLAGKDVTFSNLRETISSLDGLTQSEFLSIDGLIKTGISFGTINVLITFAVRYVKIIFLIIISPFSFGLLASDLTKGIFESWVKTLVTSLSVQIFIKFIILIPLLYKDKEGIMFKIILIGTIYIIYKLNDVISSLTQKIAVLNAR